MDKLKVTVEEVLGFCDMPMKPGDSFEVVGGALVFPEGGKICMWALSSLMPFLPAKQRCEEDPNDWMPRCERLSCPDPNGRVIFRVSRIRSNDLPIRKKAAVSEKTERASIRLKVNKDLCTGCRACELACCESHGLGYLPDLARVRVESEENSCSDEPFVCRQCGVAACVQSCPAGALSRDPVTSAVILEQKLCIGCGVCVKVCPFGAMRRDFRTKKAMPCDLCGGSPACAERCPAGAIQVLRLGD